MDAHAERQAPDASISRGHACRGGCLYRSRNTGRSFFLNNELLIDAFAGIANPKTGQLVDANTLFFPFSVTKAVTITALHLQAERGFLNYDTPVEAHWPEFASNSKDKITVRHVLTHQSGVPWMPEGVTPQLQADRKWMIRGLEKMKPAYDSRDRRYLRNCFDSAS